MWRRSTYSGREGVCQLVLSGSVLDDGDNELVGVAMAVDAFYHFKVAHLKAASRETKGALCC